MGSLKQIAVASTADLRRVLADLPGDALFRGQVAHYEKNGIPSVVTSFDRKGCVPSEMVKWCRYASSVLEAFIGDSVSSLDFAQALLQHYGAIPSRSLRRRIELSWTVERAPERDEQ